MKLSRTKSLLALALLGGILLAWLPLHADAPQKKPRRLTGLEVAELVETKRVDFPRIDDPKATVAWAIDLLQKLYGINILINERAFKFDQVQDVLKTEIAEPNPIPARDDTTLAEALSVVLARIPAPTGAIFVIRDNAVEVTTEGYFNAELGRQYDLNPDISIRQRLPRIYASFDKLTLVEALKYLNDHSTSSVILDPRASEKGKETVAGTVKNLPLDTTVRLLAEMADLRVAQIDNVFYVTTPEKAIRLEREQAQRKEELAAEPKAKSAVPQP